MTICATPIMVHETRHLRGKTVSWRWDQGRIAFFQFDELRKIAKFAIKHDLKSTLRGPLAEATGLPFRPINDEYPPWRNYSRMFRAAMLVANIGDQAQPTKIAHLLATDGQVTSDEYFHFLAQAFTDPNPSFQDWAPTDAPRFPLLFTLKFLLARATLNAPVVAYPEIIGAYVGSGFDGEEDQAAFIGIAKKPWARPQRQPGEDDPDRQARESIQVLSQVTYLSATSVDVTVSLDKRDALDVFTSLAAVKGQQANDSETEIIRRSALFEGAVAGLELDYSKTALDQTVEAGFSEGTRVERTHVVLERNQAVRKAYFDANPTTSCEVCGRDTHAEYPWADRVLDIHHVLPLCSGTRSTEKGTVLADLVAVCPTCHRAVHRYYSKWMKDEGRKDFVDGNEARKIYDAAKQSRETP
ncbi:MAG TPA: HNH endonuclease [Sphingomonadaceae bacterium]